MLDPSLNEARTTVANYRALEKACKELGVTFAAFENALAREASPTQALSQGTARSVVRQAINEWNLWEAARETGMPATTYRALQESLAIGANATTSLRDDGILSKEEFVRRGRARTQGNLFDDTETERSLSNHVDYDEDEPGYPRG